MRQIGSVYIFGYDQLTEYKSDWFEQIQNFQEKSGIRISITPNPEKVWPGDQEMLSYVNRKNNALIQSGILDVKTLAAAKEWKLVEIFTGSRI